MKNEKTTHMTMQNPLEPQLLEQIVLEIFTRAPETKEDFDDARRSVCGQLSVKQPANRFLLRAYQNLVKKERLQEDDHFASLMQKAHIRNLSGIAVVTSLIKPYMCPGKCVYCPTEARMPKSYIASEPAAARALRLEFSPYEQVKKRIEMLAFNGHNTDKIEYIVKGGTWNAYPLKYQYWFMLESFKACNNFSREEPIAPLDEQEGTRMPLEALQTLLNDEQTFNETAEHRMIGITLETRPDAISPKTIYHMRLQGCTRIELGLQATDNKILELIKRGHTVEQFYTAIELLRQAGFKVDLHFMPDLPGTTAKHDVEMYKEIFDNPALKPDMIKIYPCTVLKTAELFQWFKSGKFKPYGKKALFGALLEMKKLTPRYCRISRLIRDIPADEIQAGNMITNLREELKAELAKTDERCVCLRCREIGRQKDHLDPDAQPQLFVDEYETVGGTEYFISFEDAQRTAVYGFIRLRLPSHAQNEKIIDYMPEIKDVAFVRELHVYGSLVKIGDRSEVSSQHKGFGKALMAEAERIAKEHDVKRVAVISGVGVRKYYEKIGYHKEGTYMLKSL